MIVCKSEPIITKETRDTYLQYKLKYFDNKFWEPLSNVLTSTSWALITNTDKYTNKTVGCMISNSLPVLIIYNHEIMIR